jgi:uncharacterized protein YndB with AHSA1/START domain
MTNSMAHEPDPSLDLLLERVVDVPRELVWRAWTTPDVLMKWFTPDPWKTVECQLDLRPGGMFRTVMQSPDGRLFPNMGCCLEVVEHEKFVWTSALAPGYRPAPPQGDSTEALAFTAVISLESVGEGTKYTALVIHGDRQSCQRHAAMGFHDGWGTALTQLVAVIKGSRR